MTLLEKYVFNPNNYKITFELAESYFKDKNYSEAVSFYCKAADLSYKEKALNIAYSSHIRIAECYAIIGDRSSFVKNSLEHAIYILPERPEAYLHLSFYYEKTKDWGSCRSFAKLGLINCHKSLEPLPIETDRDLKNWLRFQIAISSWTVGSLDEGREYLQLIKKDSIFNSEKLNTYTSWNIKNFFEGTSKFIQYKKEYYNLFQHKIPGLENIEKNYSQFFQDMFVLSALKGKRNGYFLELGGADPWYGNNTALLSEVYGWKGLSFEIDEKLASYYKQERPSIDVRQQDALNFDYTCLPEIVDYLQIDIDTLDTAPGSLSLKMLYALPFDRVKFRTITFEHDYFVDMSNSIRELSRKFLFSKGYHLIVPDVSIEGINSLEDWWVHPELVDKDILHTLTVESNSPVNIVEYFLKPAPFKYRRLPWKL